MGFFGKIKKGFTDYTNTSKLKADKKQRMKEQAEKMELKRLEAENRRLEEKEKLQEIRAKRQEKIKSLKKKRFDNSAVGKVINGIGDSNKGKQNTSFQPPFGNSDNMYMFNNEFTEKTPKKNSKNKKPQSPFGGSGIEW